MYILEYLTETNSVLWNTTFQELIEYINQKKSNKVKIKY